MSAGLSLVSRTEVTFGTLDSLSESRSGAGRRRCDGLERER